MGERTRTNVLVVISAAAELRMVEDILVGRASSCVFAADASAAAARLDAGAWDLVIADLDAGGDVQGLLLAIRQNHPELRVVLLGSSDSFRRVGDLACRASVELLTRPVERRELESLLEVLLPAHLVDLAASAGGEKSVAFQIAGRSENFLETLSLAGKVAPTSVPVLIAGESGTGKELLSYFIHHESSRSKGPFVHVNCSALSETLLESELFGHEKGSFTGAHERRMGRFERAHGGTLLLDEISESTSRLQAELLRVLEQQVFERVGGSEPVRVNVRIVSTSNRNLAEEARRGRFRQDLYYRLSGVRLLLPPLRERREDIPTLVWHFVNIYAGEVHRRITALDERMMDLFEQCAWPGNVRQLRNIVRAALILGQGPVLSLDDAPFLAAELEQADDVRPATLHLQELERRAVLEALRRTKQSQVKAARLLGITDRTLREKLRRYRAADDLQPAGEGKWQAGLQ